MEFDKPSCSLNVRDTSTHNIEYVYRGVLALWRQESKLAETRRGGVNNLLLPNNAWIVQTSLKFKNSKGLSSRKYIWKCHLQIGGQLDLGKQKVLQSWCDKIIFSAVN